MYLDEETSRLRQVVGWIVDIVVAISIAWFVVFAMGTQITVTGQSMQPVLSQDDVVLMNRLSCRIGRPERFDIVVFEKEDGNYNIKRVVGLPGETVQIRDGFLFVNDEMIDGPEELRRVDLAGLAENPVSLGTDEYFLLGDDRVNSEDSRFSNVGNVNRSQMRGKVWFRISPFSEFGFIRS